MDLWKKCVTASLVLILTFSVANVTVATSIEWSAEDKILAFLTDVVKLDIARYAVTINSNVSYPSDLGGLPKETGKCTLVSDQSKIEVTYTFKNRTLGFCNLYVLKGSPIYTQQPSSNILEMADVFLQRYQGLTGFSDLAGARNVLSTVNAFENITKTAGNTKLTLSVTGKSDGVFEWKRAYNGIDFPALYLGIRNGSFAGLADDFHVYSIGSTEVKISSEEALNIAMERAKNLSWKVNISDTSVVEVANVTILDDHTSARLLSAPKEPLVLYPYWAVSLTFDKVYPGSVYGVAYNIWADTGEVFYGHLLMIGGSVPDDSNPAPPSTSNPTTLPQLAPQPSAMPESPPLPDLAESPEPAAPLQPTDTSTKPAATADNTLPIATTLAIIGIIAIATTALLSKRKRSK